MKNTSVELTSVQDSATDCYGGDETPGSPIRIQDFLLDSGIPISLASKKKKAPISNTNTSDYMIKRAVSN